MKQIILDTNAVRYFYQIECCNGEGVRDKVMKKYYSLYFFAFPFFYLW